MAIFDSFLSSIKDFSIGNYVGLEDFADKMSFIFSVAILVICTAIISVKSYLLKSIACYIPTMPGGSNFDNYVDNYCWVHGTIPILSTEKIPQFPEDWQAKENALKIDYYQWVPFVLGCQAILFYLPRILWQLLSSGRTGTDLERLAQNAKNLSIKAPADRKKDVKHIANTIVDMLYQHRDLRNGRVANVRRSIFNCCNLCIVSKRTGTVLVVSYLVIKLFYLVNSVGQLYIMRKFLGFNASMSYFGYTLLNDIAQGRDWQETRIFNRVSYCLIPKIRMLGAQNDYVAQCVLPINMLNEKIYIFLWFWVVIVCVCTVLSILFWLFRILFQRPNTRLIKKYLRVSERYTGKNEMPQIDRFVQTFLRHDGIFLVRMLGVNAGDLIANDIVNKLYRIYCKKYIEKDFRNDPISKNASNNRGGGPSNKPYPNGNGAAGGPPMDRAAANGGTGNTGMQSPVQSDKLLLNNSNENSLPATLTKNQDGVYPHLGFQTPYDDKDNYPPPSSAPPHEHQGVNV